MASALEEFEIHNIGEPLFTIGSTPIHFTNSALFMLLSIMASALLILVAMRPQAVVPGRWQMLAEKLHDMVADTVTSTAGKDAQPFFPFIFSIFIFIFCANMLSMLPYSFAVTSHIFINVMIALLLFAIIIVTGFVRHGTHFLHLFVPQGVPMFLMPLMIPIELFSFLVRPFSLSIRLFANMLAGHILLAVFAGMTLSLVTAGVFLKPIGILPFVLNIGITGFEFFVMFLQAYIYTILACVYLRDAIEMH